MINISCDGDAEQQYEIDRALRDAAKKFPAMAGVLNEGIRKAIKIHPESRLLIHREAGSLSGFTWYTRGITKCRVHAVWMAKGKRRIGLRKKMLDNLQSFVGKNTKLVVPVKERAPKLIKRVMSTESTTKSDDSTIQYCC